MFLYIFWNLYPCFNICLHNNMYNTYVCRLLLPNIIVSSWDDWNVFSLSLCQLVLHLKWHIIGQKKETNRPQWCRCGFAGILWYSVDKKETYWIEREEIKGGAEVKDPQIPPTHSLSLTHTLFLHLHASHWSFLSQIVNSKCTLHMDLQRAGGFRLRLYKKI